MFAFHIDNVTCFIFIYSKSHSSKLSGFFVLNLYICIMDYILIILLFLSNCAIWCYIGYKHGKRK